MIKDQRSVTKLITQIDQQMARDVIGTYVHIIWSKTSEKYLWH